jgi:cytochrome P450
LYTITLPVLGKTIVISDPDLIQHAYVAKNYEKSFTYTLLTALVGRFSIVSADKTEWKDLRKSFNPGFSHAFLKDMVVTMADKLERFVTCINADIDANTPTNMHVRAQTFTSDVIVTIAFGEDWGGSVPHPARIWNTELCRLSNGLLLDPFKAWFGFRLKREIKRYEKLIDDEMMAILERRLAAGQDANASAAKDICSIAIDQMKGSDGSLTDHDKIRITHQLKTFYFAGHDTTATTIAWCMWCLGQNAEALAKVRAELKEHGIWADSSKPPTYDDLLKCSYLEATIKETLRLYPPAGGVSRVARPNETFKGYRIDGAVLLMSIYTMGRHPLLWKEPETFRPDRFLDGSEENITSKFTAFSRGPRDCIGKYFAILEAKLAVSALVTNYDFSVVDKDEHMMAQLMNVPRNGAKVQFVRRN